MPFLVIPAVAWFKGAAVYGLFAAAVAVGGAVGGAVGYATGKKRA